MKDLFYQLGCSRKRWKCVGYETVDDENGILLSIISLDNLQANTKGTDSLIKLEWPYHNAGAGITTKDSYENIDRCCPASNISQWDNLVRRHLHEIGNSFHI